MSKEIKTITRHEFENNELYKGSKIGDYIFGCGRKVSKNGCSWYELYPAKIVDIKIKNNNVTLTYEKVDE